MSPPPPPEDWPPLSLWIGRESRGSVLTPSTQQGLCVMMLLCRSCDESPGYCPICGSLLFWMSYHLVPWIVMQGCGAIAIALYIKIYSTYTGINSTYWCNIKKKKNFADETKFSRSAEISFWTFKIKHWKTMRSWSEYVTTWSIRDHWRSSIFVIFPPFRLRRRVRPRSCKEVSEREKLILLFFHRWIFSARRHEIALPFHWSVLSSLVAPRAASAVRGLGEVLRVSRVFPASQEAHGAHLQVEARAGVRRGQVVHVHDGE